MAAVDDLRRNTTYHNYRETDDVIQWFWEAIESFTEEERARFIQFVTGARPFPCLCPVDLVPVLRRACGCLLMCPQARPRSRWTGSRRCRACAGRRSSTSTRASAVPTCCQQHTRASTNWTCRCTRLRTWSGSGCSLPFVSVRALDSRSWRMPAAPGVTATLPSQRSLPVADCRSSEPASLTGLLELSQ